MKHASPNIIIFGLLATGATAFGFDGYPQADKLEPRVAKVGTVLTITGNALNKDKVDEVYLTDHRFDMKVKVLEQSENILKIRIPPFAKPGRLQLLFLTAGDKPAYLEQPLYVQVDEGEAVESPADPVQITKQKQKPANTVEVASIGTKIPVPPANPAPVAVAEPISTPAWAPVKREEPPTAQPAVAPVPVAPQPVAPQQQAQPAAAEVPVTRSVTPPRLIKRTPVAMPPTSSSIGGDSMVELQLRIRTDGRVGNVKAIKGNPLYVQAATRSVREWVYECAYVGSTPVETEITVLLNFKR